LEQLEDRLVPSVIIHDGFTNLSLNTPIAGTSPDGAKLSDAKTGIRW
jgi:hypothetical protein